MKKIVKVEMGPSITETGVIGRVVELEDGSGQVQSFGERRGWKRGGTSIWSLMTAEEATRENLEERGLTPDQIEEVLFEPEGSNSLE